MNTLEVQRYLDQNNSKKIKMKVCAFNELPLKLVKNREYGFVMNLSRSTEPGSHWTALYIDKKRKASYFDSYGFRFADKNHHIRRLIKENCKRVYCNKQQLQQLNSSVCGMYASLFILHMMNGGSVKTFASRFTKNLLINDIIVREQFNFNKKK